MRALLVGSAAYAELTNLRLVANLSNDPVVVGRASIVSAAGTAVRQLVADGRVVGVFVDGPATCRYTVDEPVGVPVARRNSIGSRICG